MEETKEIKYQVELRFLSGDILSFRRIFTQDYEQTARAFYKKLKALCDSGELPCAVFLTRVELF